MRVRALPSCDLTVTEPELGLSSPANSLSKVLLPQPLLPNLRGIGRRDIEVDALQNLLVAKVARNASKRHCVGNRMEAGTAAGSAKDAFDTVGMLTTDISLNSPRL